MTGPTFSQNPRNLGRVHDVVKVTRETLAFCGIWQRHCMFGEEDYRGKVCDKPGELEKKDHSPLNCDRNVTLKRGLKHSCGLC